MSFAHVVDSSNEYILRTVIQGFSSLTDTPSCSSRSCSRSRRTKTKNYRHQGYHQDSRSRSCDILEETDDDLETDNDVLASCDELDEDEGDLPTLERVKEIITEPEETWRYPFNDQETEDQLSCCGSLGNFSTTSKPELIQPKPDMDILSMFKVSSAAQWKSISSNVEINLTEEEQNPGASINNDDESKEKTVDDKQSVIKVPEKVSRQQLLAVCWQVRVMSLS